MKNWNAHDNLPVDFQGRPIPPRSQVGYYPGYSTLSQKEFWDEATRDEITKRVENIPPILFFTLEEARLLTAVADRVLPQDDRDQEHKIPIVSFINGVSRSLR